MDAEGAGAMNAPLFRHGAAGQVGPGGETEGDALFAPPARKALRPYQADAIAAVRASIRSGNRRVVLALPTGGGKTLIASHIVHGALAKGGRAIFTAPMIVLIDQTMAAFEAEGIERVGAMQASHPRTDPDAPVQVASVQTLQRRCRPGRWPEASVVLVDECHVFSAFLAEWMAADTRTVFVGLSATPGRRGMADEWDDLVVGVTTRELMDLGFLSPMAVYAPDVPDLSRVRTQAGEYVASSAAEAMQAPKLVGDIVGNYVLRGEGRPTLAFASTVAQAKRMAAEFDAAGVPSAYVEARHDGLERSAVQAAFRRGDVRVIWSVRTMTTGVDLPVSGIIDAAPTQSAMLHQQKIGRGLRVNPGTEDLVVWDHAGNALRLGLVDELDWSVLPGGKRGDGEEEERAAPLPKPCASCAALMPPRVKVCPACGEARKPPSGYVETEDGELVPIRPAASSSTGNVVSVRERRRWYAEYRGILEERGKPHGAAFYAYQARFGSKPQWAWRNDPVAEPGREVRAYERHRRIAYAKAQEAKRGEGGSHAS